jgi:hypothetical protein
MYYSGSIHLVFKAVESGDPHAIDPWKQRHSGCLSCVCSVSRAVDFLHVTRYSKK